MELLLLFSEFKYGCYMITEIIETFTVNWKVKKKTLDFRQYTSYTYSTLQSREALELT